jgi:hypothetical protein
VAHHLTADRPDRRQPRARNAFYFVFRAVFGRVESHGVVPRLGRALARADGSSEQVFHTCLAQAAMRTTATHSYHFDAFVPGNPHSFLGATHAMDVPFWFNNASVPFGPSFPPFPPAHAALAERASRWLLDFPDTPPDSEVTVFAASGVTKEPQEPETSTCNVE